MIMIMMNQILYINNNKLIINITILKCSLWHNNWLDHKLELICLHHNLFTINKIHMNMMKLTISQQSQFQIYHIDQN